jgi:hypothetical protein
MISEDQNTFKRRKFSRDDKEIVGSTIPGASSNAYHDGDMPLDKDVAQSQIDQSRISTRWSLYHAFSGHISDIEPVFSSDEK